MEEGVPAGAEGYGENREIVFLLPADADRDGAPDLSGTGQLVWDSVDFSYVLVEGPNGTPQIERRMNNQLDRIVATNVERLFIQRQSDDPSVPFGALRIQIWLRMSDTTGLEHPYFVEATVRLRNTNREFLAAQGG